MPDPAIQKSQRFTRAARAERDRLERRRAQLFKKREDLQTKIDSLDKELEAMEEEIQALETLALGAGPRAPVSESQPADPSVLSGAEIRRRAVPLLLRAQGSAPIHYRDWLALLERDGYSVAGKRADAVFLNQVVRSPLVRATTRAGYYQLDMSVIDQLRQRLRSEQAELAELLRAAPRDADTLDQHRERQHELKIAIGRTERELDEALRAVADSESQHARAA